MDLWCEYGVRGAVVIVEGVHERFRARFLSFATGFRVLRPVASSHQWRGRGICVENGVFFFLRTPLARVCCTSTHTQPHVGNVTQWATWVWNKSEQLSLR